jgi:hypothetical protein
MKPTLYVVTMHRFGFRLKHAYLLGVFTSKTKAEKAGLAEEERRGGKYSMQSTEVLVDSEGPNKVIIAMKRNPDMNRDPRKVGHDE